MNHVDVSLWFDGKAEEAAKFYTSLFKSSEIGRTSYFTKSGEKVSGQKAGSVLTVEFKLANLSVVGLNGGPLFKFTPAMSLFVWCESEKEIDDLWSELTAGGGVRMALDTYPWSKKYGWATDKFGVDWQLNLAPNTQKIAPAMLFVDKLFGKGEDALNLYTSVFPDCKIESISRDENQKSVTHSIFKLNGQDVVLMDGAGNHGFEFNEAFSLMIYCKNQKEIDHLWDSLIKDGGMSSQCGWLKDKFGVSWQIVPDFMRDAIYDAGKSEKVMDAMYQMKKLDYQKLKDAYTH
ncbi:MAG: VOC family protein [Proteobacteria bacterium]|nr:MAG: VOC family protein [Pseudomonadota bacterium]